MSETVLRYRYRAYPDAKQTRALSRLFGCCRVVANDAIAARQAAHKAGQPFPKSKDLSVRLITQAKTTPERAYLAEVSAVPLQQSLADVDRAYSNFFASLKGKRKGKKMGPPKFRSRHDSRQTARFTSNARFKVIAARDGQAMLRLPKIGDVKFALSRPLPSDPASVTVIREADGRVYLSFVVTAVDQPSAATGKVCGIDPGLSSFATVLTRDADTGDETERKVDTPTFLRRKARALARSQRSLSRKKKGSANRAKAKQRVAVLHRKVRETRLDHAHQQAAKIVAAHDVIAVEDPNVAAMARTNLAKSVHDQAVSQFLRLLAEKAIRQGRTLVKVNRYFPSTQMCSAPICGAITGPKGQDQLGVRHWTCTDCGASHDRDVNAARNILAEGLRLLSANEHTNVVADGQPETQNACGAQVRPPETAAQGETPKGTEPGRTTGDREGLVAA